MMMQLRNFKYCAYTN